MINILGVVRLSNGLRVVVSHVVAWEESQNETFRVLYLVGGHKLRAEETVEELDKLFGENS